VSRSGADLALLLLGGFRVLADRARAELAERGYEDVRPGHDFALRAIMSGADSASELGRRLAVSKQAAARTLATLEERGYVAREPDPADRRRMRVRVTDHGHALLRTGEAVFDELRARWEAEVGADTVAAAEEAVRRLVGDNAVRLDSPGWPDTDADPDR
jgi:DNA-binding MarR family transcriptional regulator